ncbi:ATP-dependent DNA helicase DinG [Salisediminibacterium halotolerans]|nr:ATP-dependent DNA helicase DinG [Actinophytocola xinjiangensis]RPE88751.1 ATP-dependent DNA helicase DinG [Salisediminibacterium halotolerans]TWG36888.1 ATP-dependent DNA helicase DinG [Salisediminibacterium halotolerans]GEL07426.1 ATP-dependent helicase DinG [Salisediminibacterium halotolerans]
MLYCQKERIIGMMQYDVESEAYMERLVVLDAETTGVSYQKGDRIIQLAYTVIEKGSVRKEKSVYLNPEKKIPPFIEQLTSITNDQVAEAPKFDTVAPELLEDLQNAYFVAHNVDFDLDFMNNELEHAGYLPFTGPVLDTVELARIAFPGEEGYRLEQISNIFGFDHGNPHDASSDVAATVSLLLRIFTEFKGFPKETLEQLDRISPMLKSDISPFLHEWTLLTLGDEIKDQDIDVFHGIALKKPDPAAGPFYEEIVSMEAILDRFSDQTFMQSIIPDYEMRESQLDMMRFVHEQFQHDQFGCVEAGTGTGKTLAYLIPAALQAKFNNETVVISTETIQLQEQMMHKEWPTLEKMLPFTVKHALLKGRSHYLCLQKFENILRYDPQDSYDRSLAKAQLLTWLLKTDTGDVEEISLSAGQPKLWQEVASDGSSCVSPKCPWFSRCYYQRAKKRAREADIIITNHALLFSDVQSEHQIIPAYDTLIIDEAHHIEDTATRQLSQRLDYIQLAQRMNDAAGREQETIVSDELLNYLHGDSQEPVRQLAVLAEALHEEWNELFLMLSDYTGSSAKHGETGQQAKVVDFQEQRWAKIHEGAVRVDETFRHLLLHVRKTHEKIEDELAEGNPPPNASRELDRLDDFKQAVEKIYETFYQLFFAHDKQSVYWLESELKGPKQSAVFHGAPVTIAEQLADRLFAKKKRVLLTSATLTVKGSFTYMIDRLGLDDFPLETKQLESPFSYQEQVSFYVPEDMPLIGDAGEDYYIEAAAIHIYRLAQVTKGRMLVLFTSYDMLKRTHKHLKTLFDDSYRVIAQGIHSGSRSKLTKTFQQYDQALLLGTSSFWEGVDIPGDHLSAIVMARLPFSPPNDPIFQARSDLMKAAGKSPFMHLALPQAVLRFKQGFGRLIRRSSDRGIVVVLDRRIKVTRYGHFFAGSLPGIPMQDKPMDEIEQEVGDWFYPKQTGVSKHEFNSDL